MNNNPEAVKKAAKLFSENYDYTYDLALECASKVRFVTLEDEKNFFGLNTDFNGMTGSELYSKMARTYSRLGLCQSPLSWNKVSDSSFIEELLADGSVKGDQSAEAQKSFTAPTKELETAQEMSTKKLSIVYPTNSAVLDNNAKALIDREFVSIAKQFSGSRIRIEGNTDDTGSDAVNIPLSKSRAQAAADYLVKEYGFDRNRFIVIGNGSKKAKADGVTGSNEAYRTTDFELINE
jgi:NitT/TauT family transport system substrate-binding protein